MPMRLLALLVLAFATFVPLAACKGGGRQPPAAVVFRLANGVEVELRASGCGERATVVVMFAVGMDHDPPGRSGMAHVVARVLSGRGTAEAGADHTLYSIEVAGDQVLAEVDAVAARMSRLELAEPELARARGEVLADLARRRGGDPLATATSFAAESVQPARGDGWRGGIAAEVEAITLAEVEAAWAAHYQPGNARVIVVGRFDEKTMRARVEAALGALPAGAPPVPRPPADATVTGTLVIGDAPTAVAIAVPAPAASDPLYPAFLILAARLANATYDPLARGETLFVTGEVQPGERPEAAAERIRTELAPLLARPLAPADRAAARARCCKDDLRALAVAHARRTGLRLDAAAFAKALDATTPAQLAEAAALFEPKRTAAVIAGGTIR
jgi:predicted Zn-dependent peptidase